jgi:hypothetical protein
MQAQAQALAEAKYQQWLTWLKQTALPYVNGALAAQEHVSYKVGDFRIMGSRSNARVVLVDGSYDWAQPLIEALAPHTEAGYTITFVGMWRTGTSYRSPGPHLKEEELDVQDIRAAVLRFRQAHPGGYFAVKVRS